MLSCLSWDIHHLLPSGIGALFSLAFRLRLGFTLLAPLALRPLGLNWTCTTGFSEPLASRCQILGLLCFHNHVSKSLLIISFHLSISTSIISISISIFLSLALSSPSPSPSLYLYPFLFSTLSHLLLVPFLRETLTNTTPTYKTSAFCFQDNTFPYLDMLNQIGPSYI